MILNFCNNIMKYPKRIFLALLLLLICFPLATLGFQISKVDSLFESYPKTEVLVLGTFHFKDAGLDSYKPEYDIDITSDKRQQELNQILSKLKAFNPEAIGLEYKPDDGTRYIKQYQQYRNGDFNLPSNEIYQIGFKLADRLQLDRIFGIDADARNYSNISSLNQQEYDSLEKTYTNRLRQYAPEAKYWYPTYKKLYRFKDSLKTHISLIDYFVYLNKPKNINRTHGIYLVDSFKFGMGMENDYFGADMKTAWYNRNLRILQNIYRMIAETKAKRVLVVIGAGHLPILNHAIQASPELRLVNVGNILK